MNPPNQPHPNRGGVAAFFSAIGWLKYLIPLIVFIGVEIAAPHDLKPSTLSGRYVGREEAEKLKTQLAAAQKMLQMQNDENAKLQKDVEYFRASTERVTKAYDTIYQRTNIMAQSLVNLEQEYLTARQKFATELEGGKTSIAILADISSLVGKMAGNKEWEKASLDTADEYRNAAKRNVDAERNRGLAEMSANINAWKNGLPDPADIINESRANPVNPKTPIQKPPAYPASSGKRKPQN